jgi:hypothetical protein
MTVSLLSGCAGVSFSDEAKLAIPDVVAYSKETQRKAADELSSCNCPTIIEFMKDYFVMRQQARRSGA